jgi:hypothetical protein
MLVYNIKRAINILTVPDLIAKIKNWKSPYKAKTYFAIIMTYFSLSRENNKTGLQFAAYKTGLK